MHVHVHDVDWSLPDDIRGYLTKLTVYVVKINLMFDQEQEAEERRLQKLGEEQSAGQPPVDEGETVTVSEAVPEKEVPVESTVAAEEAKPEGEASEEAGGTKKEATENEGGAEKEDPSVAVARSRVDIERPGSKLSRIEEEPEPAVQPE